jgi:hypothetical protein
MQSAISRDKSVSFMRSAYLTREERETFILDN